MGKTSALSVPIPGRRALLKKWSAFGHLWQEEAGHLSPFGGVWLWRISWKVSCPV